MRASVCLETPNPEAEIYEGSKLITDFLEDDLFADWDNAQSEISEGSRNSSMSHIAGKLIKRDGATKIRITSISNNPKCNPPLPEEDEAIWNSAVNLGRKRNNKEATFLQSSTP